jgi:NAD+ kinase
MPDAVHHLINGMYELEERILIQLDSNFPLFDETPFALNDFSILKRDNSSMITIHTYINGDFLNSYWADGLIIATPTGSTGYSLSCGGPILFPQSKNLVVTPVAAHNLNVRPIVLPDDSILSFEVEGRTDNFLCTLDSRYEVITSEHQLAVRKCEFAIRLIQLHPSSFLKTMHDKLNWGLDQRN